MRTRIMIILVCLLSAGGLVTAQQGGPGASDRRPGNDRFDRPGDRPGIGEDRREDIARRLRDHLERIRKQEEALARLIERVEGDEPLPEILREIPEQFREHGLAGTESRGARRGFGRPGPEGAGPMDRRPDPERILQAIEKIDPEMHEKLVALRDRDPKLLREFLDRHRERLAPMVLDNPDVFRDRARARQLDRGIRRAARTGDRDRVRELVEELFEVRVKQMSGEIELLAGRLESLRSHAAGIEDERESFIAERIEEAMSAPEEDERRPHPQRDPDTRP